MILLVRSPDVISFRFWQIRRLLDHLGIPHTSAYMAGADVNAALQTPAGSFASNSSDLRNYFRQNFQAIWVLDIGVLEGGGGRLAAAHWLTWNDPEDPPVVYFGWNFDANLAALNPLIPSDFPIVRTNRAEIASAITSQTQPTSAYVLEGFSPIYDLYNLRTGTAVRFVRENVAAILPAWNWRNNTNHIGLWRLNLTQHATLADTPYTHRAALNNRAGEILVVPESQPDETFPSDVIVAYRYRNRVFLPMVYPTPELGQYAPILGAGTEWALYALKACQIPAMRQLPVFLECDHPLEYNAAIPDATMFTIDRDTWAWTRDFCRETGMVVHCGVTTGGMSRRRTDTHNTRGLQTNKHWCIINGEQYGYSSAAVAIARQVHDILLAGHREGTLPCGIHDHTLAMLGNPNSGRGFWGDSEYLAFRRHQASDYAHLGLSFPLEAPNNVRIRRGRTCCAKHVMPASALRADAIEQRLGETEYYEQDFEANAYSGAGIDLGDVPAGSLNIARVVIESNIAEMRAMGFPDGHGGEHGYTNTAANNSGGDYYWQALREYGYKAVRSNYFCNSGGGTARNKLTTPNMIWKGFHLLYYNHPLDIGERGLYHPLGSHGVGTFGVDVGGDITANWPQTAWRAHRRVLAKMMSYWLGGLGAALQVVYMHPVTFFCGASPTQPTARFDNNLLNHFNQPAWNAMVELLENMRSVVSVLSDYLKFGSVSDLIVVRERVFA